MVSSDTSMWRAHKKGMVIDSIIKNLLTAEFICMHLIMPQSSTICGEVD